MGETSDLGGLVNLNSRLMLLIQIGVVKSGWKVSLGLAREPDFILNAVPPVSTTLSTNLSKSVANCGGRTPKGNLRKTTKS